MIQNYFNGLPENLNLKDDLERPVPYSFEISIPTDGGQRFSSNLSSEPLFELIDGAIKGYRVHELFQLSRPGDIWEYVYIKYNDILENEMKIHISCLREAYKQSQIGRLRPWPANCIPMSEFDTLMKWTEEMVNHFYLVHITKAKPKLILDTSFSSRWLCNRYNKMLQGYARMHYHHVLIAKAALSNDVLQTRLMYKPVHSEDNAIMTMTRQQVKAYYIMLSNNMCSK